MGELPVALFQTLDIKMKIIRSSNEELLEFHKFWDAALEYQKRKSLPVWPNFPLNVLSKEIDLGLHYSVYSFGDELLGYFSLALSDPIIWDEEERGDAIYIHRMCVNPKIKGSNLAKTILNWAYDYASGINRKYIRMDTWGTNQTLVDYYISCGFKYLKSKHLGETPQLQSHYNNIKLAMFQNEINA